MVPPLPGERQLRHLGLRRQHGAHQPRRQALLAQRRLQHGDRPRRLRLPPRQSLLGVLRHRRRRSLQRPRPRPPHRPPRRLLPGGRLPRQLLRGESPPRPRRRCRPSQLNPPSRPRPRGTRQRRHGIRPSQEPGRRRRLHPATGGLRHQRSARHRQPSRLRGRLLVHPPHRSQVPGTSPRRRPGTCRRPKSRLHRQHLPGERRPGLPLTRRQLPRGTRPPLPSRHRHGQHRRRPPRHRPPHRLSPALRMRPWPPARSRPPQSRLRSPPPRHGRLPSPTNRRATSPRPWWFRRTWPRRR